LNFKPAVADAKAGWYLSRSVVGTDGKSKYDRGGL